MRIVLFAACACALACTADTSMPPGMGPGSGEPSGSDPSGSASDMGAIDMGEPASGDTGGQVGDSADGAQIPDNGASTPSPSDDAAAGGAMADGSDSGDPATDDSSAASDPGTDPDGSDSGGDSDLTGVGQADENGRIYGPDGSFLGYAYPEDEAECDVLHDFVAHGQSGVVDDPMPYQVPAQTTTYVCFYYEVPWGSTPTHGLGFRPIVDNEVVTHHYVAEGIQAGEAYQDGQVQECLASAPDARTVAIWAPGTPAQGMPEGVGMEMPTEGGVISIQIHYNNPRGLTGEVDRGGFRFCGTNKLRPQSAAVSWLGSELLGLAPTPDGVDTSTCVATQNDTWLLASMPHMHSRGLHSKIEIVRTDGSVEVLHDAPFDFENQPFYWFEDVMLQQGDGVRTTCTFDMTQGPIVWGTGTAEEMCYFFTLATPAGSLSRGVGFTGGAGGNCADGLP